MEADCKVVYLIFFILLIIVDFSPELCMTHMHHLKYPPFENRPHKNV